MRRSAKSGRRQYRLGRRAEASSQTRQLIVEATFALHSERGIAETSMKDIAERAGVSVGTVYHYFPTYADTIAACGAYTAEQAPAPTSAIFAGAADRRTRIARLDVYRAMRREGFGTTDAADRIAATIALTVEPERNSHADTHR